MSGQQAIYQLLVEDGGVTALVDPAASPTRISSDVLPQGVTLPAIRIELVSSVDRNIPSPGVKRRVTDRVQVTALAATVPEAIVLRKAIRHACGDARPTVAGITDVVVLTDGAGPDGIDEQTLARAAPQDFRVSYNETR